MSGKVGASSTTDGAQSAFSTSELVKHPLAYPKQRIYDFFMSHEAALLVVTVVGVAAGVLLLVWFLAFSGMNEPVQFIYDSF